MWILFKLIALTLLPALVWGQALHQEKVGFYVANKAGTDCSQATLELADAQAQALGQVLLLPPSDRFGVACQWEVASSITVTSPLFLPYANDPVLKVNDNITLTLSACPVVWGDYFVIDANETSTGTVAFPGGCSCEKSGTNDWTKCDIGGGSGSGDITDVFGCVSGDCSSITAADGELLDFSAVNPDTTTEGLILPQAADCSLAIALGQVCYDTDDGILYLGDGVAAGGISGSGSGGGETLEQTVALGRAVTTLNSQANALDLGDGNDGFRVYVGTGGPLIECYIGTDACHIVDDIPTGKTYQLNYAGTPGIQIDSSFNVTLLNNAIEWKSMWFGAGALSTDGTQCTDPVERTINSGPKAWVINCADNAGSIFYGSVVMPDSYSGGTVTFQPWAENEDATPSGVLNFDFSAMCRSDGDVTNATWGTAIEAAIPFNGQYEVQKITTVPVTPNGPCLPGDLLMWQAVMDEPNTTTETGSTYILGVKMEYPTNDWSDN
jgi:hypothetical protein